MVASHPPASSLCILYGLFLIVHHHMFRLLGAYLPRSLPRILMGFQKLKRRMDLLGFINKKA